MTLEMDVVKSNGMKAVALSAVTRPDMAADNMMARKRRIGVFDRLSIGDSHG